MKLVTACLIVVVALASAAVAQTKKITTNGTEIVLYSTKCKLMLKQTARGFNFGGLEFGSGQPVSKVGAISLDPKVLQAMNAQAQILDQFQFTSCQQLNSIPLTDPKRVSLIAVQALASYQLGQMALLAQMYASNSDKLQDALLKWIVSSGDLMQQVWAKQFTAAHSQLASEKQKASEATAYAIDKLGAASDSSKLNEALRDPLRMSLSQ